MREESRLIAVRRWTHAHPGILLVGAFAVSALIMWLIPVSGTTTSLAQSAALAALAVVALFSYRPEMLAWNSSGVGILKFGWYPLVVALFFGAAVAWKLNADGTINLHVISPDVASEGDVAAPLSNPTDVFLALVPICLFTGFFEEALFRGLLFDMTASRLARHTHGVLIAAIVSAIVFGLLHIVGDASSSFPLAAMRFIQAAIFGLFMCTVYHRTKSIWPAALTHGLYDVFVLWPSAFVTGYPVATLMPTGAAGLVMNGALVLAFVPLVFISARILNRT